MSSDLPSADPSAAAEAGAPLLDALERHSPGAREHADSTAAYAFAAAVELGLDRRVCELTREAARLHEVGQVYAAGHDQLGQYQDETYRLARGAGIDVGICRWLLLTRERFDGAGPDGLAGEAIPLPSRLIRATCVFHAALRDAPPGGESAPFTAIERIRSQAGAELDPQVVGAVAAVVGRVAT